MARIAFCQEVMVEYMGFMSMSAALKAAGHEVEVFIDLYLGEQTIIDQIKGFNPDIVGFSVLTPSVPWACDLARRIKKELPVITVFGNVHAILNPEQMIATDGVDVVCTGEGETPLRRLADAIDSNLAIESINGLWLKSDGKVVRNPAEKALVDMDAQPDIDRGLYNKYRFFRTSPYLRVMTGRGCPFRCSFCTNTVLMDHFGGAQSYIRKKSPEAAVAEIRRLIENHPGRVRHIFFIDEVFWVKNEWLREFLQRYRQEINIPFTANFRFGGITEEDIRLLASAGATGLAVATETANESQRRGLLNKPVKNQHILQVVDWLHRYRIPFASSVFFGLPGDAVQDHIDRLPFFRTIAPTYLWTTFFQPYPGLPMVEDPQVKPLIKADLEYQLTSHQDLCLEVEDSRRLVRLKKVYFLMMKFPKLERPLLALVNSRIPLLCDLLFLGHFSYYIFIAERISPYQYFSHLWIYIVSRARRRRSSMLHSSGASYEPSARQDGSSS